MGKENIEIFKENKKIFGTYIKKEKKEETIGEVVCLEFHERCRTGS